MIVLGEKYKFTKDDLDILNRKFDDICFIKYNSEEASSILSKLEKNLNENKTKIFVLNTKKELYKGLIKYIVKLKIRDDIKIYTIEEFLEKFLYKTYIPDDFVNIHHLKRVKPYNKFQYIQKRLIDYIVSIPLLLILPIVMLITKYKIKKRVSR